MTENPLVAPASRPPELRDYLPGPDELRRDGPIAHWFEEGDTWWEGAGLLEDADKLVKSTKNKDWIGAYLNYQAVGLGVLGAAVDPIGTVASLLAGWMLEHLKPLELMLDGLAGNPEIIEGRSNTWVNVSGALQQASQNFAPSIGDGTSQWEGEAADAYRKSAEDLAKLVAAAGVSADGIGPVVKIAGEAVATVRAIVRDLIAALVGQLVNAAVEEAATLGLATPVVVSQVTAATARTTARVATHIDDLLDLLGHLALVLSQLLKVLELIDKALRERDRLAQAREATGDGVN